MYTAFSWWGKLQNFRLDPDPFGNDNDNANGTGWKHLVSQWLSRLSQLITSLFISRVVFLLRGTVRFRLQCSRHIRFYEQALRRCVPKLQTLFDRRATRELEICSEFELLMDPSKVVLRAKSWICESKLCVGMPILQETDQLKASDCLATLSLTWNFAFPTFCD